MCCRTIGSARLLEAVLCVPPHVANGRRMR